jgi:hypothetical protein
MFSIQILKGGKDIWDRSGFHLISQPLLLKEKEDNLVNIISSGILSIGSLNFEFY